MTALVLRGDARRLPLPDASVDLVVTSPPYYALRDYRDGEVSLAGQIGSESTSAEYLETLWECTAEWVRVLKPEGSLFVDLGDKYSDRTGGKHSGHGTGRGPQAGLLPQTRGPMEKSLLLLPERYRIGCVDRLGLIVRAVLVWKKPNGLPESVTDRVRRSHEDWVHLVKQPRYYAAIDEIRESCAPGDPGRTTLHRQRGLAALFHHPGNDIPAVRHPLGKLPGSVWTVPTEPLRVPDHLGVNHFAAFPTEWPRRLILGWSPPGICLECGQGRRSVVDRKPMEWRPSPTLNGRNAPGTTRRTASGTMLAAAEARILGYFCACTPFTDHPGTGDGVGREQRRAPPTRPAVVLDPFAGTGTVPLVADVLGRVGIGVDLSAGYCRLARWRTSDPDERARALRVEKPAVQVDGQLSLLEEAL